MATSLRDTDSIVASLEAFLAGLVHLTFIAFYLLVWDINVRINGRGGLGVARGGCGLLLRRGAWCLVKADCVPRCSSYRCSTSNPHSHTNVPINPPPTTPPNRQPQVMSGFSTFSATVLALTCEGAA